MPVGALPVMGWVTETAVAVSGGVDWPWLLGIPVAAFAWVVTLRYTFDFIKGIRRWQ